MIYRGSSHTAVRNVSFIQAMLSGVDENGRGFVPVGITPLPVPFFRNIAEMSAQDVAYVVVTVMMGNDYKAEELRRFVDEWIVDDMNLYQAGEGIYALEPWWGATMSQYDIIGRFQAILIRNCYDREAVSLDSVLFSPSMDDSCAAISQAFRSVIGKSPVMLQAVGTLSDIEKRQVYYMVDRDLLHLVTCDQQSLWQLSCRAFNNQTIWNGSRPVIISDVNVAALVARVYCFFDAYRLLVINGVHGPVTISPDARNDGDMLAARVAVEMGLPVNISVPSGVENTDSVISDVYRQSGYILNPRAAERWKALNDRVMETGETGVLVNPSHPAKFRSRIEPLINRVLMLPNKLHFNDIPRVHYKRVAPSVNALKNCFINY